ncbi:MAG TPA: hypothetical protein VJZ27_14990 [Aggregatilineales bacterium]|nr:hypothetical protein [Aggregatilineales bacterium]
MSVTIRKVENKVDFKAFFEFPWKLYQGYEHWIPELPSMRHETLDRKKHAAWEYMEGDYFVAWRNSEPVGTIAAFVNHRHNETHAENTGFFGFFECINDQEVANALFSMAESYLREKGVEALRGPANFSSNELYGLLVDSFDKDPMMLMPYNPAYYVTLIENAGFEKAMDLLSWRANFSTAYENVYEKNGEDKRIVRTVRKNMQRRAITVRTLDTRNKKREFAALRDLYHQAWEKNWGFIPMTERELDGLVKNLGMLVMPEYTYFGYVKDELAGFMLLIPNFNQIFKHVDARPGIPEAWWLLKTLWHWKIRPKVDSLRVVLFGVKEEFRGLGVDAALNLALAEQMAKDRRNLAWAEASWILETNDNMNRLVERFGAEMHRRHRIYQKLLLK